MMKIRILIDNAAGAESLVAEHGLSLLVETEDGKKILIDTGLTGRALDNAVLLGVDVGEVDSLVLSHGHSDHTGGLGRFVEMNERAKVYASRRVGEYAYWSVRGGKRHCLSPNAEVMRLCADRMCWIDEDVEIEDGVHLVFCRVHKGRKPVGGRYLSVIHEGVEAAYEADDEVAVAVRSREGLVIVSPCSHSGLLNIVDSCVEATGENRVRMYVGGLHLLDEMAEEDNVRGLAEEIVARYGDMDLYTSHCTGKAAQQVLGSVLGEKFHKFCTGDVIEVEEELSEYEKYCKEQAEVFFDDMEDRCFGDMMEGHFVRSH